MSVWHYCCVCGHFLMTKDAFELFRLWTNGNSLLVRQCIDTYLVFIRTDLCCMWERCLHDTTIQQQVFFLMWKTAFENSLCMCVKCVTTCIGMWVCCTLHSCDRTPKRAYMLKTLTPQRYLSEPPQWCWWLPLAAIYGFNEHRKRKSIEIVVSIGLSITSEVLMVSH